ncbi:MAG: S-methyl-5'-thioadenosine phosphorylase, partial [Pseudomonadota bacterium]
GDEVDVAEVVAQMGKNGELARAMVVELIKALPKKRKASPIDTTLDTAVITAPEEQDPDVMAKLDAVAKRLFAKKK